MSTTDLLAVYIVVAVCAALLALADLSFALNKYVSIPRDHSPSGKRYAARQLLWSLLRFPLIVACWPVVAVGMILWGMSLVIDDAFGHNE